MNKLILAIPHSSLELGILEKNNILIDKINYFNQEHSDLFVDKLFTGYTTIKFPLSRYSIDVERYWDNSKEECYKIGQGKFYSKLDDGTIYRNEKNIPKEYSKLYWNYHNSIKNYIENGHNFIIDCHSFSDKDKIYTDFCIGFNNDNTKPDPEILSSIESILKDNNFTFEYNKPYSGSLTVNTSKSYKTIMIEVNKNTYLINNKLKADYYRIKSIINNILLTCKKI